MNTNNEFAALRQIEECAGPRLSERYGRCPVCQLTAIAFRTASDGTLICCCSCPAPEGEWKSPILMFTGWCDWVQHGDDAPPPTSLRLLVDGGDTNDGGEARAELLERLQVQRARDAVIAAEEADDQDDNDCRVFSPVHAARDHHGHGITDSRSGDITNMKTKLHTISIEIPASTDVLVAGLDPHRLHPPLAAAEEAVKEAERQLQAARTDIGQRQSLVAKHTREIHTRGAAAVDDFERESVALKRAEMLCPMWEANVANAKRALALARDAAITAMLVEARRRQTIINTAAAALFAQLEALGELEDALAAHVANLPSLPGGGMNTVGSFRQDLVLAVPGARRS